MLSKWKKVMTLISKIHSIATMYESMIYNSRIDPQDTFFGKYGLMYQTIPTSNQWKI